MNFRDLISTVSSAKPPVTGGRAGGLLSLHDDMGLLFGDFTSDGSLDSFPAIDVIEKEDAFEVRADLPGMEPGNIDITATEGGLMLTGERREEKTEEDSGTNYVRREVSCGSFCRVVALPDSADIDRAEASFQNGALSIEIPKRAITKN